MKKQIVAILAIIAVITTLFTVSALSNEVGYELSLCDAIDISIGNATVTDFLNGTDKATVQVYNSKRYEGDGECIYRLDNPITDAYIDQVVAIAACPTSWSILTDKEDNFCKFRDTTFDWSAYMAYRVQVDNTFFFFFFTLLFFSFM
jgi:hypothetical protein